MIQHAKPNSLIRAAGYLGRALLLPLALPLALLCLAGCADVHGQTAGSADAQRAGGHIQLGFPF
jgi:hypothetical protein